MRLSLTVANESIADRKLVADLAVEKCSRLQLRVTTACAGLATANSAIPPKFRNSDLLDAAIIISHTAISRGDKWQNWTYHAFFRR